MSIQTSARALGDYPQRVPAALAPADVCVVIVSYKSAADLPGLLSSLPEAAPGLTLRVVVVDNDSSDDSLAVARAHGAIAVASGGNLGYSGGINVGRRWTSGCSAILVANPDLRFRPGAVRTLFDEAVRTGDVATPALFGGDGSLRRSLRREPTVARQLGEALFGDHWPSRPASLAMLVRGDAAYEHAHATDWATGAALMIPVECDGQIGAWNEEYFLYSEEVDFASRLRDVGRDTWFVPSAGADHAEGGSGRSDRLLALDGINRIRYFSGRHGRLRSAAYGLAVALEMLLRISRAAHRNALRPVLVATARAVRGVPQPTGQAFMGIPNGGRTHAPRDAELLSGTGGS